MINNTEKDLYDTYCHPVPTLQQYTENRQSTYEAQQQIRPSQPASQPAASQIYPISGGVIRAT